MVSLHTSTPLPKVSWSAFTEGVIACSISARTNKRVWYGLLGPLVLDTLQKVEGC